jgi:hypothetical protein
MKKISTPAKVLLTIFLLAGAYGVGQVRLGQGVNPDVLHLDTHPTAVAAAH